MTWLPDAIAWWTDYGRSTPQLQQLAMSSLSVPATSAAGERVFAAFKLLWSDHRNRLVQGRMW